MVAAFLVPAVLTFALGWVMKCNIIKVGQVVIFQATLAVSLLVLLESLSQLAVAGEEVSLLRLVISGLGVGLGDRAIWLSNRIRNFK